MENNKQILDLFWILLYYKTLIDPDFTAGYPADPRMCAPAVKFFKPELDRRP